MSGDLKLDSENTVIRNAQRFWRRVDDEIPRRFFENQNRIVLDKARVLLTPIESNFNIGELRRLSSSRCRCRHNQYHCEHNCVSHLNLWILSASMFRSPGIPMYSLTRFTPCVMNISPKGGR